MSSTRWWLYIPLVDLEKNKIPAVLFPKRAGVVSLVGPCQAHLKPEPLACCFPPRLVVSKLIVLWHQLRGGCFWHNFWFHAPLHEGMWYRSSPSPTQKPWSKRKNEHHNDYFLRRIRAADAVCPNDIIIVGEESWSRPYRAGCRFPSILVIHNQVHVLPSFDGLMYSSLVYVLEIYRRICRSDSECSWPRTPTCRNRPSECASSLALI
jgi:hypothetical protein